MEITEMLKQGYGELQKVVMTAGAEVMDAHRDLDRQMSKQLR